MTIINEEKKNQESKESIRMMNSQTSNTEKINRKKYTLMKFLSTARSVKP